MRILGCFNEAAGVPVREAGHAVERPQLQLCVKIPNIDFALS